MHCYVYNGNYSLDTPGLAHFFAPKTKVKHDTGAPKKNIYIAIFLLIKFLRVCEEHLTLKEHAFMGGERLHGDWYK